MEMNIKPMNAIKSIAVVASSLCMSLCVFAAGPVKVTTTLDSAYIIMGKQTAMNVEIVQDKGTKGRFLNVGDTLSAQIEIAAVSKPDTNAIGSDREEIRQQIQAVYDAGYEEWILWNASNRYSADGLEAGDSETEQQGANE